MTSIIICYKVNYFDSGKALYKKIAKFDENKKLCSYHRRNIKKRNLLMYCVNINKYSYMSRGCNENFCLYSYEFSFPVRLDKQFNTFNRALCTLNCFCESGTYLYHRLCMNDRCTNVREVWVHV